MCSNIKNPPEKDLFPKQQKQVAYGIGNQTLCRIKNVYSSSCQRKKIILHLVLMISSLVSFVLVLGACSGSENQPGPVSGQPTSTNAAATTIPTTIPTPASTPTSTSVTQLVPYPTSSDSAAAVLGVDKNTLSQIGGNGWHIDAGKDVTIKLPGLVCVDFPVYPQNEINARLKGETLFIDVKSWTRAHMGTAGGSLITNSATVYWGNCPHLT